MQKLLYWTKKRKSVDSKNMELMDSETGLSIIAKPLADKKLSKKALKVVKRAAKAKMIKRGIKEVQKAIRKHQKGVCVLAGDISPIDVICHIPILCEENDIPYVYVASKADLGTACTTKRPTSCVLITPGEGFEHQELYDELKSAVEAVALS